MASQPHAEGIDKAQFEVMYMLITATFIFTNWLDVSPEARQAVVDHPWISHVISVLQIYFALVILTRQISPRPENVLVGALTMYAIFLMATRARFWFMMASMLCIAAAMFLETTKNYERSRGKHDIVEGLTKRQSRLHVLSGLLIAAGVLTYLLK